MGEALERPGLGGPGQPTRRKRGCLCTWSAVEPLPGPQEPTRAGTSRRSVTRDAGDLLVRVGAWPSGKQPVEAGGPGAVGTTLRFVCCHMYVGSGAGKVLLCAGSPRAVLLGLDSAQGPERLLRPGPTVSQSRAPRHNPEGQGLLTPAVFQTHCGHTRPADAVPRSAVHGGLCTPQPGQPATAAVQRARGPLFHSKWSLERASREPRPGV